MKNKLLGFASTLFALHLGWHIILGVIGVLHGGIWGLIVLLISILLYFKCYSSKCKNCDSEEIK